MLRIADPELTTLLRLLERRYPDYEWASFVRFGWRETPAALVVTLASVDQPRPGDLDEGVGHVALDEQYTLRTALAADNHPLAIGVVHSHPENCPPEPSPVDDDMDRYYARYFPDFAPDRPYVSVITARIDGEVRISGRVFWRGDWHAVTTVVSDQGQCTVWRPQRWNEDISDAPPNRIARLRTAFGREAAFRLRNASVAVVGAGGTGSAVVEVLARAGIGKIIVVDPDIVEESNLERLHGGIPDDAVVGRPKVDVARRHAQSIDPSCEVVAMLGSLPQPKVIDEIVTADFVIGCTDQQHSRLALSDISLRYLITGLDCGVALEGANGNVTGQIIQLLRLLPSDPCALCRDLTSPTRLSQELMSPEEQQSRREQAQLAVQRGESGRAYWHEMPQLNTVGYLTTTAGGLVAGYAIGYLSRRFTPPFARLQMNIVAPFFDVTDVDNEPRIDCVCRRARGTADQGLADALISPASHWPAARAI